MEDNKTLSIIDENGQLFEIKTSSFIEQGVAAGVFDDHPREVLNRRALWAFLGMCNRLLVALDKLSVDKSAENIDEYKEARRRIESGLLYHRFNEGQIDPAEEPRIVRNDIKKCRYCNANIIWLKGLRENIPVDAQTVYNETQFYSPDLGHIIHFATCKNQKK
jgi:hypothetical protein